MKFTIFISDTTGNAKNCFYKQKIIVTDQDTLASAVKHDYVAAEYICGYRNLGNFERSDCLMLDCDNNHSDNPDDWKKPEDVAKTFPDVEFVVHYSRNHMKTKDGKTARPKFHILFPIDEITNADKYATMKRKVAKIFPYFDENALDAARFFFGTQNPKVEFFDGSRNLSAFLDEYDARQSQSQSSSQTTINTSIVTSTENPKNNLDEQPELQSGIIPQGTRNSTMLNFAEKLFTKLGVCEEAKKLFIEKAKECKPPLSKEELVEIGNNAIRYYKNEIAKNPDYIAPEDFNAPPASETQTSTLEPEDFSDIGQAKILAREYKDKLRYSDATSFLYFNGSHWEENKPHAQGLVQELTDRQREDAQKAIEAAQSVLKKCNALDIVIQHGIKQADKYLQTPAQRSALEKYKHSLDYEKFIRERRKNSNINAVLNCVQSYISIKPEDLDADAFLLNTPDGTVDLRTGEMKPHNPNNLITKQTAVSPDDANMRLWTDALNIFFCNDSELINYVQEIVGLAAIGKVFIEAIIIAYGNGRNGKSTFWNTIARVLGNNSYSGKISAGALTLGYRQNVKSELAEARGKRLLIASELEEGMRLNTSVVKNLCSTDRIQAEKKFKAPFDFTPSHTLVLYTNHLPKVGTTDEGTWRRLILVPFNARISETQDIKNYSDYLFENAGGAVLSWVIEGAKSIIAKNYKLDTPEIVSNAVNEYRADNDWFQKFMSDCCEIDPSYSEKSSAVYDAYHDYCTRNNESARNQRDFYKVLDVSFKRAKVGNKHMSVYGLKLRATPLQ